MENLLEDKSFNFPNELTFISLHFQFSHFMQHEVKFTQRVGENYAFHSRKFIFHAFESLFVCVGDVEVYQIKINLKIKKVKVEKYSPYARENRASKTFP